MRYGHKAQLDRWLNSGQTPEKTKAILDKLQWLSPEWWYLSEPNDGEEELKKLEAIKKSLKIDSTVAATIQAKAELTIDRKPVPPVKKAPGLIGKAVQMFKTVTGPQVSQEIYEKRLSKCTREGGLTFAPIKGTVKAVGTNFVQIEHMAVQLPSDESPDVDVGQTVEVGQPIAKSGNAKPCPYLKVKNTADGEQLWCRSCGCGEKALAELHNKLKYAKLVCPRSYPLFTAENESNTPDQNKSN